MRYLSAVVVAMTIFAGDARAADEKITVAVFTKNTTNPAYQAFRIAADQVARSAGARIVHYVPKQPDNVDEQKTMVEQAIKDRPDAVVFIPVDDVAMIPSVKLLNDAKIPVVLASNPLPGHFVTFVGADDFEIGYREARYLFEHLGGKGKIVVIEGTAAAPTNRERVRGYKRAFAEFPGIQVLASGVGNYQQPDARRVMETFLKDFSQIDAVLSANDGMALGALEAQKATNRTAVVIGINGILPAVKLIETGALLASVDFNMFKIGCTATRAALRHLKGEPLPEKIMLPAEIIDKTNNKAWLVPVEQRSCPECGAVIAAAQVEGNSPRLAFGLDIRRTRAPVYGLLIELRFEIGGLVDQSSHHLRVGCCLGELDKGCRLSSKIIFTRHDLVPHCWTPRG
jgi:ribose transport system substrate-binding protein